MNAAQSRRDILKAGGMGLGALAFPMINSAQFTAFASTPDRKYSRRTMDLMKESIVIDMLDTLSLGSTNAISSDHLTPELVTLFRSSGITAFHNSRTTWRAVEQAPLDALEWFARWNGFVGRNSDMFTIVCRGSDIPTAKAKGKIAIIMGLQNSNHFQKVEDVRTFYEIGQRVSQLTYNTQNLIGSGSTDRIDGGLSDYGATVVNAMNDVGMMVDVSHSGDRTTLDAIEQSKKPIAFTHSNCRALNDHPRAKTDEAIRKLAAKGGVMGITGVKPFVSSKENVSVYDVVDQIDHVAKLVGIEHVGIGTDADLWGHDSVTPEIAKLVRSRYKASYKLGDHIDIDDFKGPSKMFDLTEALVQRRYSDAHIRLILGQNFERLGLDIWI
ncbi:dipeptidase [soil metagenome]